MELPGKTVPINIEKKIKASMTVEAALAIPIFFFACLALCYLLMFVRVEYVIQREMYYTAKEISGYGVIIEPVAKYRNKYLSEAEANVYGDSGLKKKSDIIQAISSLLPSGGNGISLKNLISDTADSLIIEAVMENKISDTIKKYLDSSGRLINCDGSILYDYDKCIFLKCNYYLTLPLGIFGDIKIPVSHTLRYRYFTGTEVRSLLEEVVQEPEKEDEKEEEEKEEEELVLITETGKCYHYSYSCPALNIRPSPVLFENVGSKRNDGGGKYKPCEICAINKKAVPTCYITPDGDRYHFDKGCYGLKRTISEVPISQVGKRRECKRCKNMKERRD